MEDERVLRLESEVAHLRAQVAAMHQRQELIAAVVQALQDEARRPKGKAAREAEQQHRESQIAEAKEAIESIYEIQPVLTGSWFSPSEILEHLREYGLELDGSDQQQKRTLAAAFRKLGVESRRRAEGTVYIGLIRPTT